MKLKQKYKQIKCIVKYVELGYDIGFIFTEAEV